MEPTTPRLSRHQAHDAGVGALGGCRRRVQLERAARIDGAGTYELACGVLHRLRLAGERRLVDHRGRECVDSSIDGNDLARLDEQPVAHDDIDDGHVCGGVS